MTSPLSEEEATQKVLNLGPPFGFLGQEYANDINNDIDSISDNMSDISDAHSYRSIVISDQEKLRRELLNGNGHPAETPKFYKYNYDGYNKTVTKSRSFDINLIAVRNPFPRLGSNYKKKIFIGFLIVLLITIIVLVPITIISRSHSHSSYINTFPNIHTVEYVNYWTLDGNSNNLFFDNATFGVSIFHDPCIIVSNYQVVRNIINSKIICQGEWCESGSFSCASNILDCYDLTYVIPYDSPEFQNACKNITGNLIMTWKRWSNDVLTLPSYQNTIAEITEILGSDNINYIRGIIETCGTQC